MKIKFLIFFLFNISLCYSQNICGGYDIFYTTILTQSEQKRLVQVNPIWEYVDEKIMIQPDYQCIIGKDTIIVAAQYINFKKKVIKSPQDYREEIIPAQFKTVIKNLSKKSKSADFKISKNRIVFNNKNRDRLIDFYDYQGQLKKTFSSKKGEPFVLSKSILGELDYALIKIRIVNN
jgi:c-di-AMP phosphodiesterase-like protein